MVHLEGRFFSAVFFSLAGCLVENGSHGRRRRSSRGSCAIVTAASDDNQTSKRAERRLCAAGHSRRNGGATATNMSDEQQHGQAKCSRTKEGGKVGRKGGGCSWAGLRLSVGAERAQDFGQPCALSTAA